MAEYDFYVSGDVRLDEELCKKFHTLYSSGIPKVKIMRNALAMYLAQPLDEIIKVEEIMEEIELPDWEYKPVPEKAKA